MSNILTFENFQGFLDYNKDRILGNSFVHYHLIKLLERLNAGQLELFDAYNVVSNEENSAMCLWVTGNYFIYSDGWDNTVLEALVEKVKAEKYKDFVFLGERDLIIQLFKRSNVQYEIIKDRLIYECAEVIPAQIEKNGMVENASNADFDELVKMSVDNYIEEYNGKGQKTTKDMQLAVANGITTSSLFVLKFENVICSMVQVINDRNEEHMIGNLFTKVEFRNQGFAYSLLHTVTEGLLNQGYEKCGLISDITNLASNRLFTKIGFKPIYKWVTLFKEGR